MPPDIDGDVPYHHATPWLDQIRQKARRIQQTSVPEASGHDIICMSETDLRARARARLRNNMANTILEEGHPVESDQSLGHQTDCEDEQVDWQDVEKKLADANGAATRIEGIREAGVQNA